VILIYFSNKLKHFRVLKTFKIIQNVCIFQRIFFFIQTGKKKLNLRKGQLKFTQLPIVDVSNAKCYVGRCDYFQGRGFLLSSLNYFLLLCELQLAT